MLPDDVAETVEKSICVNDAQHCNKKQWLEAILGLLYASKSWQLNEEMFNEIRLNDVDAKQK